VGKGGAARLTGAGLIKGLYAITDSGSSSSSSAHSATAGNVIPFQRGAPSPATTVVEAE
jgi:hypothetical protein